MSISSRLFKIKRGFESFLEFFKNLFSGIFNFFKNLFYHPATEKAGLKIRKAKDRVVSNIMMNKYNLKKRNFDDHGFKIEDHDS